MRKYLLGSLSIIISAVLLYYLSSINYNLFHITIETALIVVGILIFAISVISQEVKPASFSKMFGFALLTVSFMTLLHIISYKGMNILPGHDANLPTQLWICINIILAVNVLVFATFPTPKIKLWKLGSFYIVLGIVLAYLCLARIFPDCYIEGVGLTPFKKISEYVIICIYLIGLLLLWLKKNKLSKQEFRVSIIVIIFLSISEFMFTLYVDVYGISNFIGHFIRLIAFSLLLHHTVISSIKRPYVKISNNLKKSRDDLRRSENNFKLMFEDAPLPYQSLDEEGNFIIVNNAWLKMLGYEIHEVIGKWFGDFIDPDYAEKFKTNFPEFKRRGEIIIPFIMIKKNGDMINVNFNGRIGYDESGNFRQTHCILRDVTDQQKSEELIRKKEEEQRLLLQQLHAAIVVHDTDTSIKYCNPLAEEILGISNQEILGTKADLRKWQIFHESGEPMKIEDYPVSIVLRTKEALNHYVIGMKVEENSDIKWLDTNGFLIYNDANEIERVLISFIDISHRKKLEKNRLLLELQLRNQQKLESIGTLASGVAHEINNPINGIMNYGQLILDSSSADIENKSYAKEIIHETIRVADIVKNLLMFSRQETKNHSKARVEDIIEQTLSLIKTIIAKDQIQLDINIQKNLPEIQCRSQQIQQVLMNLMTNARDSLNKKYEDYHENKKIIVSAEERNNNIRIVVEDYGTGISVEVEDKIFDPFFTTKPRDKGTGLGLSISYGIIKEHNGELTYETKEGEFTRFIIDLPIK